MLITYERFGSLPLPIYDPTEPIGSFPSRSSYADLPGGGAYRNYGQAQAPRGRRIVRRSGLMLESTLEALDTAFAALTAKRGRVDRLYGRRANGDVVWMYAELAQVEALREPRSLFRYVQYVALDVETEFVLYAGPWYGSRHANGWTLDTGELLDTGLVLNESTGNVFVLTAATPNILTVTNGGNAVVRDVTYTVRAAAGGSIAPTAPGLASLTISTVPSDSGLTSQLEFLGTVAANTDLIIQGGGQSIYNNTAPAYADLDFGSAHAIGGWVVLGPGANSVQVYYDGTTGATLTVEFFDGFE